jgi:hypothetical protein
MTLPDPYEEHVEHDASLEMRAASGRVNDRRPLVTLLYLLGRDELPLGRLEELIDEALEHGDDGDVGEVMFSNGWLAEWARFTSDRLGVLEYVEENAPLELEELGRLPDLVLEEGRALGRGV